MEAALKPESTPIAGTDCQTNLDLDKITAAYTESHVCDKTNTREFGPLEVELVGLFQDTYSG